jgi:hypothetical protein
VRVDPGLRAGDADDNIVWLALRGKPSLHHE